MDWRSYWETDSSVYVSARHKAAHYARLADDLVAVAGRLGKPLGEVRMLDYGCGEALSAGAIAGRVARLDLSDSSERVRRQLAERFGHIANVRVRDPEPPSALPAGGYDLVVLNSVLQYVAPAAAVTLIESLGHTLSKGGRLLVADVLPPDLSPLTDARELVTFAARDGFLIAAVTGLLRTALSDYAKVRARVGLTRFAPLDFVRLAATAGLIAEPMPRNIGHNPHRLAFLARRAADPS
jgi:SAM-dependent methyltransferase